MNKKARTPVELATPVVVFKTEKGVPKVEAILTLDKFTILNGHVSFSFTDEKGRIFEGRIKQNTALPAWEGAWVSLCLPLQIHYFKTISPDFIFCIPSSRRVLTLYQFKQEFPGVLTNV